MGSGAATMSGSSAAFAGRLAVFADMKPHQRVEVLLGLLGSEQRATLAARDVIVRRRGSNHNTGRPRGCTDQQRGVKISLSNSGPSTHGTSETNGGDARRSACRGNVLQNYSQEQNEQY